MCVFVQIFSNVCHPTVCLRILYAYPMHKEQCLHTPHLKVTHHLRQNYMHTHLTLQTAQTEHPDKHYKYVQVTVTFSPWQFYNDFKKMYSKIKHLWHVQLN